MCMRLTVLLFAASLALAGVALADHHVTGTWTLEVNLPAAGQAGTARFELVEADGKVTGKYFGALGEHEVVGTVSGMDIELSFEGGEAGKVTFKGKIDGESMSGECSYGALGQGTFQGTRS